jgi:hypothetical protein
VDKNIGLSIPMILGSFVNTDGTIDMCNSFKYVLHTAKGL